MTDTPNPEPPAVAADNHDRADRATWTRLRAIIESLADGIVIVDRAGVIRFANPAAARLFTRTPEALEGTSLGSPLVAGETTEMEIVRRGGGEVVHAELRVVNTEWEGETAELVSLRDITDRKYAEERAKQLMHEREARLEAEAASRAKSDFLAIMSHELRTPLNAILGYSELIELGLSGDLSEKMRDQVARIRRSAKHLLGLVNDILDLAKVEAGRLNVANAPAHLSEAVTSALTLIQPQAISKNLAVVVAPGLEQLPVYIGDEQRVQQILVNLLSNALKCTEPGGTITIEGGVVATPDRTARLQPGKAYLRLTVRDTGSGIPPDKLRAIFEPFVQADRGHTRAREGSGLGLTIGQRLARAMGGEITVSSTLGQGSAFSLWLPTGAPARPVAGESSADWSDDFGPREASDIESVERRTSRGPRPPQALDGLADVGSRLLAGVACLVDAIVDRIRRDEAIPMTAGLRNSQIVDHLTTLLADIAGALIAVEESAGEPSTLLADGMEIQRLVAERHGVQRARLGWTESSMRREFMIIREELEGLVRQSVPTDGPLEAGDAVNTVNRFLDQAEYLGVRALTRARLE